MRSITLLLLCAGLFALTGLADNNTAASVQDADAGTAITVIFDNSGSMQGTKIEEAKQAFNAWLSTTPQNYAWSLINFDNGGRLVIPFGHNRDRVAAAIQRFIANTNTPIVNSLKIAAAQIKQRRAKVSPYERHLVLLFTDGEENQDPGGNPVVLETIAGMRAQNIEVVGIGYHGDGDYLAQGATHYYQADDIEALKAGLGKVDAEVDINGEVQVTAEDLAAIKSMGKAGSAPGATAAAMGDTGEASTPVVTTSGKDRTAKYIIGGIVIVLLLRRLTRSNKRS